LTRSVDIRILVQEQMADSSHDSKNRFSSRVDAYVAARPRYPRAVIDHLNTAIGLTPGWKIVDLGSGTGISCELFLANGNPVTGVEPNAAMRSAAEASLRGYASFTSVNASAEATTLVDHSTDLVVAAQAFHWFDIPSTRKEVLRILRPDGWALLMWNNRQMGGTPFLEAYEKLLIDFGTDYLKIRHNNIGDAELRAFFGPAGWQTATFPNHQHLDWPGLTNRVLSSSYIPQPGDPRHEPMLEQLRAAFDRHHDAEDRVTIEYQTELFYGRPSYNS
jgi:SAM-dependent methyltransferase